MRDTVDFVTRQAYFAQLGGDHRVDHLIEEIERVIPKLKKMARALKDQRANSARAQSSSKQIAE
jgi:hypothetical protein